MSMEMALDGAMQQAAVVHGPGDLRLEPRSVPAPAAGQALIAVRAVGICGSDFGYLHGTSKYPVVTPFTLGHEASGVVVALGASLGRPRSNPVVVGTRVALEPGSACGHCERCRSELTNLCREVRYLGSAATVPPENGALQEYICLPVERLVPVPDGVSDAVAALLEPLAVAEHAVRRADVGGASVLIAGGGAIGQLLALAARAAGARDVTVCEKQGRRRQLALEHGADRAVTPTEVEHLIADGPGFDVVLDATGSPAAVALCLRAAKPGRGRVVIVGNLPSGSGLPAEDITRAEIWVTATFRFPGGLGPALDLVTAGLDIGWLVEHTADFEHLDAALSLAATADAPLKIQINPTRQRRPAPT